MRKTGYAPCSGGAAEPVGQYETRALGPATAVGISSWHFRNTVSRQTQCRHASAPIAPIAMQIAGGSLRILAPSMPPSAATGNRADRAMRAQRAGPSSGRSGMAGGGEDRRKKDESGSRQRGAPQVGWPVGRAGDQPVAMTRVRRPHLTRPTPGAKMNACSERRRQPGITRYHKGETARPADAGEIPPQCRRVLARHHGAAPRPPSHGAAARPPVADPAAGARR